MSASTTSRPTLVTAGQAVAPVKPIDQVRQQLAKMETEFRMALPEHIPVARFNRVVMTAANQNQDLALADRRSLLGACMRAAQDGLLPDGREGALVIFNTKVTEDGKDRWVKGVQWMPMVYGIIKKMRNSGELASIVAHEVYQRDHFKYRLGDEESIEHQPYIGSDEPGPMIAVYAIAKLKDGTVQREVMTRAQVERVRQASRSKDKGPWVSWYEEMARKTVVRRLSKYLPMSSEIDAMLRRDDALSVSGRAPDETPASITIDADPLERGDAAATAEAAEPAEQKPRRGRLAKAAATDAAEDPLTIDAETGEIGSQESATDPNEPPPASDEELFR